MDDMYPTRVCVLSSMFSTTCVYASGTMDQDPGLQGTQGCPQADDNSTEPASGLLEKNRSLSVYRELSYRSSPFWLIRRCSCDWWTIRSGRADLKNAGGRPTFNFPRFTSKTNGSLSTLLRIGYIVTITTIAADPMATLSYHCHSTPGLDIEISPDPSIASADWHWSYDNHADRRSGMA